MANRKEDEKNERIIRSLLKLPDNRRCIKCKSLFEQDRALIPRETSWFGQYEDGSWNRILHVQEANMAPELLRDVLMRIEESESTWTDQRNVVACDGVCRNWRDIVKEIVKTPKVNSMLTFPISLKQLIWILERTRPLPRLRSFGNPRIVPLDIIKERILQWCRSLLV
ncbi:hypothetical protein POM88_007057 [Heracleum sosnowskyi]|uniref:F-box domain-containing protein n=1 Tax=Heracleum sosnowskyi TaxID=360622 RepID=A0AAD8J3X3_9APIA|nr:hypothetical protein POM88_007057 [Heracleum sosnowskyi]